MEHVALIAALASETGEHPVGVGRYVILDEGPPKRHAEVAFVVDEAHRGLGIGTLLLRHLAVIARTHGVGVFESDVLASNDKMLEVFRHSGLPMRRVLKAGVVHVSLALHAEAPPSV